MGNFCSSAEGAVTATQVPFIDRHMEARLVERLQAREPEVMVEIYDRYSKIAWAVARRIVQDEAVAEDIVQEIFLRVWSRPHAFQAERGTLAGWIATMARNLSVDYLRSTEGRLSQGKAEAADLRDTAPTPGSQNFDFHSQLSLTQAFAALSPNQRKVIRLTYYEGMSQTEMASHLNQPLGTIKSWVRTAIANLRREFGDPHLERVA